MSERTATKRSLPAESVLHIKAADSGFLCDRKRCCVMNAGVLFDYLEFVRGRRILAGGDGTWKAKEEVFSLSTSSSGIHLFQPTHPHTPTSCDQQRSIISLPSSKTTTSQTDRGVHILDPATQSTPHSHPHPETAPNRRSEQSTEFMYSSHAHASTVDPPPVQQPFRVLRRPRSSGHERNNG
nr:hypothetical protein CFP56_70632 [Quercus suber]